MPTSRRRCPRRQYEVIWGSRNQISILNSRQLGFQWHALQDDTIYIASPGIRHVYVLVNYYGSDVDVLCPSVAVQCLCCVLPLISKNVTF